MAQFVIILCVVGIVIWILKMMFKLTFKSLIVLCNKIKIKIIVSCKCLIVKVYQTS